LVGNNGWFDDEAALVATGAVTAGAVTTGAVTVGVLGVVRDGSKEVELEAGAVTGAAGTLLAGALGTAAALAVAELDAEGAGVDAGVLEALEDVGGGVLETFGDAVVGVLETFGDAVVGVLDAFEDDVVGVLETFGDAGAGAGAVRVVLVRDTTVRVCACTRLGITRATTRLRPKFDNGDRALRR
jgi:hypothetical protein